VEKPCTTGKVSFKVWKSFSILCGILSIKKYTGVFNYVPTHFYSKHSKGSILISTSTPFYCFTEVAELDM